MEPFPRSSETGVGGFDHLHGLNLESKTGRLSIVARLKYGKFNTEIYSCYNPFFLPI